MEGYTVEDADLRADAYDVVVLYCVPHVCKLEDGGKETFSLEEKYILEKLNHLDSYLILFYLYPNWLWIENRKWRKNQICQFY